MKWIQLVFSESLTRLSGLVFTLLIGVLTSKSLRFSFENTDDFFFQHSHAVNSSLPVMVNLLIST
jgi:hypothetical protein